MGFDLVGGTGAELVALQRLETGMAAKPLGRVQHAIRAGEGIGYFLI